MSDSFKGISASELLASSSVMKQADLFDKLTAGISANLVTGLDETKIKVPKLQIPRSLRLHDQGKFKDFNVDGLIELRKKVRKMNVYENEDAETLERVEDALSSYIEDFQEFKRLNDEQLRTITMKKAELELEHENHVLKLITKEAEAKLEVKYDWKEKWRHLFIKSLGTILFIGILLVVGTLVHKYDWLHLPYSSLFKNIPMP